MARYGKPSGGTHRVNRSVTAGTRNEYGYTCGSSQWKTLYASHPFPSAP